MSSASIAVSNLTSRTIRQTVTGNANGIRTIGARPKEDRGFWGNLWGLLRGLLNFSGWLLGGLIGGLRFTFTAAWGLIVSGSLFIYDFNWNITDENIDQQIAASKGILGGYLGESLGNLTGWLACGIVPAATIFVFNEKLGLYLLKEVGVEALEEFTANLAVLIQATARLSARNWLFNSYKSTRRWVKNYFADPNSSQSQFAKRIFGDKFNQIINDWGEAGSKPWSFRIGVEERIEQIEDPFWENFWEEFVDEAIDACIEAGYVLAGGLDDWVAQQKLEGNQLLGVERAVEITPSRDAEQEKLVLVGNEKILQNNLPLVMANHTLLHDRNVGQWVGHSVRESMSRPPISIQLKISLSDVEAPPIYKDGKPAKRVSITVPNVSRAKVDWDKVKAAVGGTNGYMWGRFYGVARLDTGHSLYVYAATSQEAEQRLNALIQLSDSEINRINITEETWEGRRQTLQSLRKYPTKIYPISFTVVNQQRVLNEDSGKANLSGVYSHKRYKIPLYTQSQPDNFEEIISDLFRIPGASP